MDDDSGDRGRDPFTAFWQDAMAKSPFGMMGTPPADTNDEMFKRMRQSFFDAWEKHCIEFMGSETFLSSMKKSMDTAIAFRKQVNEFLTKTMSQAQIPTKADNDTIVEILRGIEEGVTKRLDDISRRVSALETSLNGAERVTRPTRKTKGTST
jgi:hypothetical protein